MIGTALRVVVWIILIPILFLGCYGFLANFNAPNHFSGRTLFFLGFMIVVAGALIALAKNVFHRFLSYFIIVMAAAVVGMAFFRVYSGAGLTF